MQRIFPTFVDSLVDEDHTGPATNGRIVSPVCFCQGVVISMKLPLKHQRYPGGVFCFREYGHDKIGHWKLLTMRLEMLQTETNIKKEQANIHILNRKWSGIYCANPQRKPQSPDEVEQMW